ncbi:MAG: TSUP family transporter, partial [Campylobacterales bacterium]
MITALLIGIVIGFFSGFLGIGGGTILVPLLVILGWDFKSATGISVTQMFLSSLYGSYLNYRKGSLKIGDGLALGIGGG